MSLPRLSRRSFLTGLSVATGSAVVGYVVARGSSELEGTTTTAGPDEYEPDNDGASARPLAAVADIPLGGGLIIGDLDVVLTRNSSGIRAFSATCTHQACTVGEVADGVISCPCHGSQFDIRTGGVRAGPADRPLPEVAVVERDGAVFRA